MPVGQEKKRLTEDQRPLPLAASALRADPNQLPCHPHRAGAGRPHLSSSRTNAQHDDNGNYYKHGDHGCIVRAARPPITGECSDSI